MQAAPLLTSTLDELTREADQPALTTGQVRGYRGSTWVWLGLMVACASTGIADPEVMGGFLTLALLLLPVTVIKLRRDARFNRLRHRESAEQALTCYLEAVKRGRWDVAWDALAPEGRTAPVRVPRIRELKSHARVDLRSTPAALGAYWGDFTRSSQGLVRRVKRVEWLPINETETSRRYHVAMTIQYYPTWILLTAVWLGLLSVVLWLGTRRSYQSTFTVTVFKRRSQWWVLDGEMGAPEEGAAYVAELPVARVARR